jgi:hypothetical protein
MDYSKLDSNLDWYRNTYNKLITTRKYRGLDKSKLEGYYEEHHILPRCLGGKNNKDNLVLLTAKEHILAHMLLARINYTNNKIIFACTAMCMIHGPGRNKISEDSSIIKFSLRSFALSRELFNSKKKEKIYTSSRPKNWGDNISKSKKGRSYGTSVMDPNGIIYRTLRECASVYNVTADTIKNWATRYSDKKGFRLVESTEKLSTTAKSRKVISPDGVIFDSVTKCSEFLGIDRHKVSNWIKNNPEKGFKYI